VVTTTNLLAVQLLHAMASHYVEVLRVRSKLAAEVFFCGSSGNGI
jgi:hypothetical protein